MAQQNRNSPHLNHLHNGSAPPSPSMSNAQQQQQQQGAQSRQSVGYASPPSYPSPSMSNAQYNYPPPNQQNEPYRASPTGSNGSLSLPSMRSLDPLQHQQSQHHMGSPLPPPVAQMGGPYYHNQGQTLPHPSHQYANVTSDPNGQGMRYALPVTDSRVMSGGRHKKEIKRRTKTGCLTCRKRRIKCDEAHPACRNCQKSKRECLGYDPIFKNNPGPAAIQPAPSSAPSQPGTTASAYGNPPDMTYMDANGNRVPIPTPPPGMTYSTGLIAETGAPLVANGESVELLDPALSIDPSLAQAPAQPAAATYNLLPHTIPGKPNFHEDLTGGMTSASPYSSGTSEIPHLRGGASSFPPSVASTTEDLAYTTTPDKRPVKDLLDEGGPVPPVISSAAEITQNPKLLEGVKQLYFNVYAPAIESFLESKWFQQKGMNQLLMSKSVLEGFRHLTHEFPKTQSDGPEHIKYVSAIEARVVWGMAAMVRSAVEVKDVKQEAKPPVPDADDALETARRLDIFEALLTGQVAEGNELAKPVQGATDPHRYRELDFWYTLANFVAIKYEDPSSAKAIDDTLGLLRNLLDGRENRDVLYSIAVVRAIGHRVSEYSSNEQPLHLDESDNRSKLHVAKSFVINEGAGNHGTTNVIRRFCELAARSWGCK